MENVKVSVIIPVYNAENYLAQCLDTVTGQSLKEIEIICVDDGSTDNSVKILEKYAAGDDRIRILHQENRYAGRARNLGMQYASGKYLIFWDSDDFFDLRALETLYDKAEESQADICICDAVRYDHNTGETIPGKNYLRRSMLPEQVPFDRSVIGKYLFNFTSTVPWNKLFRRSFVEENGLQFQGTKVGNDIYFVMTAMFLASSITVVKQRLIFYRFFNQDSLTGHTDDSPRCTLEAYTAVREKLEQYPEFTGEIRQSFDNKALVNFLFVMERQTVFSRFKEIYEWLKNEVFPDFGLDHLPEGYVHLKTDELRLQWLLAEPAEQYLLYLSEYRYRASASLAGERIKLKEQLREEIRERKQQKKAADKAIRRLETRLDEVENSTSYKVGRKVTYIPRKVKETVKKG